MPNSTNVYDFISNIHDARFELAYKLQFLIKGFFGKRRYRNPTIDNISVSAENVENKFCDIIKFIEGFLYISNWDSKIWGIFSCAQRYKTWLDPESGKRQREVQNGEVCNGQIPFQYKNNLFYIIMSHDYHHGLPIIHPPLSLETIERIKFCVFVCMDTYQILSSLRRKINSSLSKSSVCLYCVAAIQ